MNINITNMLVINLLWLWWCWCHFY